MQTIGVDKLNTLLLVASFILAYFLPFHLFLFAYAVLGPLHYLTEISWLKEHQFFTKGKYDGLYLLVISIGLALITFLSYKDDLISPATLICLAFGISLVFLLTANIAIRVIAFLILVVSIHVLSGNHSLILFFSVFLPTLVHVYLFTGFFMLYGTLKNKSVFGFINIGLLILFGASFFILPSLFHVVPSTYMMESYLNSFGTLHIEIAKLFGNISLANADIFATAYGVSIMQFIAFAYTYHYVNWFSKTRVIRWHTSAKRYQYGIAAIWLFSVSLYAYSFVFGLIMLYFLSMLHVFLEFPLNHKTIGALFKVRVTDT